ncbi:MAG: hypothetical protein R6X20_04110 [Phycisphaerae bacterium]
MHRTLIVALAGLVVLAGTITAEAAGVPWKEGDGKKDDAGASGSVDLKTELNDVQYNRLIKPIEAKLADVEKTMKTYEKEKAKPAGRQNPRLLLACKERAATFYLGASLAAKNAANRLREDRLKNAIKEQYQAPNEQKAIDIYLELAMKAQDEGNVRGAIGYYKRILSIDKDNGEAKEALTKIAKELKQKARTGSKSTGGGSDDDRKPWERDDDYSGTGGKHYDGGRRR